LPAAFPKRAACLRPPDSSPTRRSSDLLGLENEAAGGIGLGDGELHRADLALLLAAFAAQIAQPLQAADVALAAGGDAIGQPVLLDRKSTRLNSSHVKSSYAVFCLKKKR